MKTASIVPPDLIGPVEVVPVRPIEVRSGGKIAALLELTKPRIAVMILMTVAVGFLCGNRHGLGSPSLWWTIVGTSLVAGAASAWNQLLERARDARMRRTRNRPLPSARLSVAEAAWFGSILGIVGLTILVLGSNLIAAILALVTFLSYVLLYTPLKPITTLNTFVGAIPGALPPVIGYAAATGQLGLGAVAFFLIQFFWQFPHFLAIAWIYREDYALGGYRMLPVLDPGGKRTGRQATLYALALVPASLLPTFLNIAGRGYLVGALAMGLIYLGCSVRFWLDPTVTSARRLMFASFFYLPAILILLVLDPGVVGR